MSLVDFDFKMLRCSRNHRQRLAKIYKDVQSKKTKGAAERRLHLLDLLTACSFDQSRGVYVPLSETVFLLSKLQKPLVKIETLTAPINQHFPYTYFTNPLLLPLGYHVPGFDIEHAPVPKDRLTNAGFIVVTSELDCERIEEFEQNLDWFAGKDGDFASAPFAALDKELGRHQDYRGYCAVYSGRRSIHMHFAYDTKHLINAPWDADWQSRLDSRAKTAAVMKKAYWMAWDHVHQGMARILAPLGKPDEKLRTATQWRRAPFGINKLEKNCDFLGLSKGQRVPQIVIYENVRERRPKGSTEWLIDPHLSAEITSRSRSKRGAEDQVAAFAASDGALEIIRDACEAEWDALFPGAAKIGSEGGEIIIRFANHAVVGVAGFVKPAHRLQLLTHRGAVGPERHGRVSVPLRISDTRSLMRMTPNAPCAPPCTPSKLGLTNLRSLKRALALQVDSSLSRMPTRHQGDLPPVLPPILQCNFNPMPSRTKSLFQRQREGISGGSSIWNSRKYKERNPDRPSEPIESSATDRSAGSRRCGLNI
jgi:hypothetical protein